MDLYRIILQRDLPLHYNYGGADVEQWGKNTSALTNRPDIPPLSVPVPPPMGTGSSMIVTLLLFKSGLFLV